MNGNGNLAISISQWQSIQSDFTVLFPSLHIIQKEKGSKKKKMMMENTNKEKKRIIEDYSNKASQDDDNISSI